MAAAACVSRRDSSKRLTATASRTFVSSSAASGRPRSAKTLPELATTLFALLALRGYILPRNLLVPPLGGAEFIPTSVFAVRVPLGDFF